MNWLIVDMSHKCENYSNLNLKMTFLERQQTSNVTDLNNCLLLCILSYNYIKDIIKLALFHIVSIHVLYKHESQSGCVFANIVAP